MAIRAATRVYADLDLDFKPHPLTGDLPMKYDEDAVKRAVRHLILTNAYERKFHPEIDSTLRQFLFEPMGPIVAATIRSRIKNILDNHEPRVKIEDIDVVGNERTQSYEITITFTTLNIIEPIETKIFLKRVR